VRAFFPGKDFDYDTIRDVKDPNWMMILPLALFVVAMFYFGLHSQTVVSALEQIAALTM
jgi:multicomponent Na+:H+ antiporter subunit D